MEKIQPNKLNNEQKFSLKTRVITALLLAAVVIPGIFVGHLYFLAIALFFTVVAGIEIVKVTKVEGKVRSILFIFTILAMLMLVYYVFVKNIIITARSGNEITILNFLYANLNDINISEMMIVIVAGVYFLISFLTEKLSVTNVLYFIAMVVICSLGFQSLLYLRYVPFSAFEPLIGKSGIEAPLFMYCQSAFLILYVALGVLMNDMGAYFVGIFFGKHKMNPRISPKKTWEGFAGGIVISMIFSLSFALIMSACKLDIHPLLTLKNWYWILLISALMPVLGCIGDFVFSAIKRTFNVKDYSNIFPGHGGVLDRLDSMLFASGLVAGMLVFLDFIGVVA